MDEKSEKCWCQSFRRSRVVSLNFRRGQENSQYRPNSSWVHLLVVPVFQGPWFISGISDLLTVKIRQKIMKCLANPLLLMKEVSERSD